MSEPFSSFNGHEVKDSVTRKKTDWFVVPEMYGAIGDGVTDDTQAIKDALAAAIVKNAVLMLMPKTYLISDTITIANSYVTVKCPVFDIRGISRPKLLMNDPTKPIIKIIGSARTDLDFGGTIENIEIEGLTISRSVTPNDGSIGVDVQYAERVTLKRVGISDCQKCISFGNVNGLFIDTAFLSNNAVFANSYGICKKNNEGATGLRVTNAVYYPDNENAVFCLDHTDNSQSGDRVFDNIEIGGRLAHIYDFKSGTGFAGHVFLNKISADYITAEAFMIRNDTPAPYLDINISNVWINILSGNFIYAQNSPKIVVTNATVDLSNEVELPSLINLDSCTECIIDGVAIKGAGAITRCVNLNNAKRIVLSNIICGNAPTFTSVNYNGECEDIVITGCIIKKATYGEVTNAVTGNSILA